MNYHMLTEVRVAMNELRTFSETRIFADVVQAGEVAFVWGAVKQPSVTQHAVSAIF